MISIIKKILRLDLEKAYISPVDLFLLEFNRQHPEKSQSQLKEIKKHQKLSLLRNNKDSNLESKSDQKIWEGF